MDATILRVSGCLSFLLCDFIHYSFTYAVVVLVLIQQPQLLPPLLSLILLLQEHNLILMQEPSAVWILLHFSIS